MALLEGNRTCLPARIIHERIRVDEIMRRLRAYPAGAGFDAALERLAQGWP
jgi:hypothetical protein